MIISTLQENLKKALFVTSGIAEKNINLPILNSLKINAINKNIELISTNLEIGIIYNLRGQVKEDGEIIIDAKTLYNYVNLLPSKQINLESKNKNLEIHCDTYQTKINTEMNDDFPLIPQIEDDDYFIFNLGEFRKAISQVVFAVNYNENKPDISSVFFQFQDQELILAGTDTYRLAERKIKIKSKKNQKTESEEESIKKIIIPIKTIQEINRILSGLDPDLEKTEIKCVFNDNQVQFSFENLKIISKLINGRYPDYKQIIPQDIRTTVIINRDELLRALKVSALFSEKETNDVCIDFPENKNQVIVSSNLNQKGENITYLEANVNGKDNGIKINIRYILDGLQVIREKKIKLEIIDGESPCIMRGPLEKDFLYLIMPIQ